MEFEIIKNDIVNMQVDAVVLPANKKLKVGSGASEAIFNKAGKKELTEACKEKGYCEVGQAIATDAFQMDARYIIHAVVPKWIDGKHNEYDLLVSAYVSALNLADAMQCESIAFPLLASGNNKFDFKLAFEIAKKSIELHHPQNLNKVFLVIKSERTLQKLKDQGASVSGEIDEQYIPNKEKKYSIDVQKIISIYGEKLIKYLGNPETIEECFKIGKEICIRTKDNKEIPITKIIKEIALQKATEILNNPENKKLIVENVMKIIAGVFEKK